MNVVGFNLHRLNNKKEVKKSNITIIYQTAEEIWSSYFRPPFSTIGRRILEPYWLGKYSSAKVVTISNSVKNDLEAFGLQNITVVHPGMEPIAEPREFRVPNYNKEIDLVFCSRLVEMKNPKHAFEVFRRITETFPNTDVRLRILGEGPLTAEISSLARAFGPKIESMGYVSDEIKFQIFAKSDFLLATSIREGWGLTVSEAAAVNCIPVGYDVSGLRDSILCANGILCDPHPIAMAKAISDYIESKNLIKLVPNGGLHSWDAVSKQLLSTIKTS